MCLDGSMIKIIFFFIKNQKIRKIFKIKRNKPENHHQKSELINPQIFGGFFFLGEMTREILLLLQLLTIEGYEEKRQEKERKRGDTLGPKKQAHERTNWIFLFQKKRGMLKNPSKCSHPFFHWIPWIPVVLLLTMYVFWAKGKFSIFLWSFITNPFFGRETEAIALGIKREFICSFVTRPNHCK